MGTGGAWASEDWGYPVLSGSGFMVSSLPKYQGPRPQNGTITHRSDHEVRENRWVVGGLFTQNCLVLEGAHTSVIGIHSKSSFPPPPPTTTHSAHNLRV